MSDITNTANAVNAGSKIKMVKPFQRQDRKPQPFVDRHQPCRSWGQDILRVAERDVQHAEVPVTSSALRRGADRDVQHAEFPVPSSAVRRCPERDVQHAESSVPSSAVRRCVERDVQHADIPVPFSALRRCTERDVQHADSSVAPGLRARSVARSGPSAVAQVAHEDSVRCAERDVQLADTSLASSAFRSKSVMPPFPTAFLPPLPPSPDKEVSEPLQAPVASVAGRISDVSESSQADPQDVLEYEQPIHELLLREQLARQPLGTCLDRQPQLNAKMRAILIDWLVDVAANYKLRPLTLFLTVRLIDQYLDRRPVPRRQLQLVGVAAMLIAAKFEEICPPEVQDFVYITADAYTRDELIEMEIRMLAALEFRISTPTAAHFLERVGRVGRCDARQRNLAQFLIELTLTDYSMSRHLPSHLACSAVIISNCLLQLPACPAVAEDMGVTESDLEVCIHEMHAMWVASKKNELQAVRKKFRHSRYHSIADAQFPNVSMPSSSATVAVNESSGN